MPQSPIDPPSVPLARRRLVDTSDVDEARRVFSRLYAESTIEPLRGVPFGCKLDVVSCGDINIVAGVWPGGGRAVIPELVERYVLQIPLDGMLDGRCAGVEFEAVPGFCGAIFSPGRDIVIDGAAGHRGHAFSIERGALEAHFRAMTGHELRGPLCFDPVLDLGADPGATVAEIANALRREAERPGGSPLLIAALRDALYASLLTNAQHSASVFLARPPPRVVPGSVRKAEEYIEAHAAEPITLVDIAAVAGVSVRALQAGFKTHRNVTPMERLKERRLELARERLLHATPETTVGSVVTALALGDAGRFSSHYKKRFGESPSETLGRARARGA